jgi:hypothetical protein
MQGLGRSTAEWSAADIRGSFNEVVKIITDVKPQNDFCMDRHGRSNHETCDYQKKVLCEVAKASNTFRNMPAVDSYDRHFAAFL